MDTASSTIRLSILGAGKGGMLFLEQLSRSPGVEVVGIADRNPDAPGLHLARSLGIPTTTDALALIAQDGADLIIDVTGDPSLGSLLLLHKPPRTEVLSGPSALLVWKLVQYEQDLRQQVVQAEKLATIGLLASGIAHEINNPLYAITGLSDLLRDETQPAVVKEYIDEIVLSARRIATIVQDLNAFIRRPHRDALSEIDLNRLLDEAIRMAQRAAVLGELKVVRDYQTLPKIRGNQEELYQVFVNLVTNAVQAMEGRGTLTLATSAGEGFVSATVRDTGPGITEQNLTKIFDPFFTTKEQGKGTGLGLHIVRDIVTRNGGEVTVKSRYGHGAVFTVQLPIAPRAEP